MRVFFVASRDIELLGEIVIPKGVKGEVFRGMNVLFEMSDIRDIGLHGIAPLYSLDWFSTEDYTILIEDREEEICA